VKWDLANCILALGEVDLDLHMLLGEVNACELGGDGDLLVDQDEEWKQWEGRWRFFAG